MRLKFDVPAIHFEQSDLIGTSRNKVNIKRGTSK